MISAECSRHPQARLTWVLSILGLARSVWYAKPVAERKEPGRKPKGVSEELAARIKALAEAYPWWGYKRIGVMARREGLGISNKQVYRVFKAYGLLQRKRVREAALYQAARLCPKRPMSCGRPM
jgi:HTH-like domain